MSGAPGLEIHLGPDSSLLRVFTFITFSANLNRLDHLASGSSRGNVAPDCRDDGIPCNMNEFLKFIDKPHKSTKWRGTTVSGEHAFPDPDEAAKELRDTGYKGSFQAPKLFPYSGKIDEAGPLLLADYMPGLVTDIRAKIKTRKLEDSHIIEPLKKLTKQIQYTRLADQDVGLDKWWKEKGKGLTLITREEPVPGDDTRTIRVIDSEATLKANNGQNEKVLKTVRDFINEYTGGNKNKKGEEWKHVAIIQKFSQITDALHRPCQGLLDSREL